MHIWARCALPELEVWHFNLHLMGTNLNTNLVFISTKLVQNRSCSDRTIHKEVIKDNST